MGYNAVTEEPPQQTAPAKAKPVTEPPAPQGRKAPLPGAPVSRSNGGSGGDVERASPALKQLAKDLGMTVSEYLANDKFIREGKTHHRYS
jgi:pyruvate/2-oxoglutarate dehydrogenase complex dihydrolipoamide acyltransferase (E2) component